MRALVDSSVLIAASRPRERLHTDAVDALAAEHEGGLGVPVTILAETMSFLGARIGVAGQRSFWDAFTDAGIEVVPVDLHLMDAARRIDERYADTGFGFADCTLLAACEAMRCARVLSFDSRLAIYRPSFASSLEILP